MPSPAPTTAARRRVAVVRRRSGAGPEAVGACTLYEPRSGRPGGGDCGCQCGYPGSESSAGYGGPAAEVCGSSAVANGSGADAGS